MKRLVFSMPAGMHERLKTLASKMCVSMADVVRFALLDYLKKMSRIRKS